MGGRVKVALIGLGPIGVLIGKALLRRGWAELVAGVDLREDIVGRDLGEVLGAGRLGVRVTNDYDEALSRSSPDVAVMATVSRLKDIHPYLSKVVEHGVNVVSTCEELVYPWAYDEGLARRVDEEAREAGVTVLGTGINPGFLMDVLPAVLTTPCVKLDAIEVTRQIDAGRRRLPFQKKVGAGLSVEEFRKALAEGRISGHVGLEASAHLLARAVGWALTDVKVEAPEPVVAEGDIITEFLTIREGSVAGVRQRAVGYVGGDAKLTLNFIAFVGARPEYDEVVIKGVPRVSVRIEPCVHGDYGTAGVVANVIPKVVEAGPGLKTMIDLTIPSYRP